jgi:hypothetical protein
MNFKTATLLALIGLSISFITGVIYLISSFEHGFRSEILGIPSVLLNGLNLISRLLLVIFFYHLYKKQK